MHVAKFYHLSPFPPPRALVALTQCQADIACRSQDVQVRLVTLAYKPMMGANSSNTQRRKNTRCMTIHNGPIQPYELYGVKLNA